MIASVPGRHPMPPLATGGAPFAVVPILIVPIAGSRMTIVSGMTRTRPGSILTPASCAGIGPSRWRLPIRSSRAAGKTKFSRPLASVLCVSE